MGQCVPIGTARSPADFKVYLHFKRKSTETYSEVLRSVAILGLIIDRRFEQLGMAPVYEAGFKKKVQAAGRTRTVIVDIGKELLEPAAKVAADLSVKYPQHASPTEWKCRVGMYQNRSVKYLQDMREDMQSLIERLKHCESREEITRARKYLDENLPSTATHGLEERSKRWLDAMLLLRNADFTFYAAREAADHAAFFIDKRNKFGRYTYWEPYVEHEQNINLPTTWDNPTVKAWREMEKESTKERDAMDTESEENDRQHEALKPMLTNFIKQGMTNQQIQATLEAQKKPRQFIRDLMFDVIYLRFTGVEKHKPPKIEVIMSPAKEDQPVEAPSKQVPECPEGQYWNSEQGKCLPIKPPKPEPEKPEPEAWNKPTILRKDQIDSANEPSY